MLMPTSTLLVRWQQVITQESQSGLRSYKDAQRMT